MPLNPPTKKEILYGGHLLTIETGEIAKQASGAVMVSHGDTVVLVTVVAERESAGRLAHRGAQAGCPSQGDPQEIVHR